MGSYELQKELETMKSRQQGRKILLLLLLILLLIATNLLALGVFTGHIAISPPYSTLGRLRLFTSPDTAELLSQLKETHQKLLQTESLLQTSTRLTENLIALLTNSLHKSSEEWIDADMPSELREISAPQKLPLGFNKLFQSDSIHAPMGHRCMKMKEEVVKFMDYKPGGLCPDDDHLAQKLMLGGCEPLPKRRCRPPTPPNYTEPHPFPSSMWTTPPDTSIVWTPYACKSYGCLIDRKNRKDIWADCKDCFDLNFREKDRWLKNPSALDFHIDDVLRLKKGTVRIGLDLGGGTGTFAVRMRERNVSVVTTSMNFDGPFNNFIASRGVVPIFLTISQRLPFFDNTLDLVHSMHVLSNWVPHRLLEFTLYDIHRVLRPGGVFWLDHFFCLESQFAEIYAPMIERIGYNKLRWHVGPKLDSNAKELYLSALLEKPLSRTD